MEILFTALSLVAFVGCLLALTQSARNVERGHSHYLKTEAVALALKAERDRVTVVERDCEALRRELRKLAGRFYADRKSAKDDDLEDLEYRRKQTYFVPYARLGMDGNGQHPSLFTKGGCDNWDRAKIEGPQSDAASCECEYCVRMRTARRAEKAAILATRAAGAAVKRGE